MIPSRVNPESFTRFRSLASLDTAEDLAGPRHCPREVHHRPGDGRVRLGPFSRRFFGTEEVRKGSMGLGQVQVRRTFRKHFWETVPNHGPRRPDRGDLVILDVDTN